MPSSYGQRVTQFLNSIAPLGLAVVVAFVSLSKKHGNPGRPFVFVVMLLLWAFNHTNDFPFGPYFNQTAAPTILIFLAHQYFLHYGVSSDLLDIERAKHGATTSFKVQHIKDRQSVGRATDLAAYEPARRPARNWRFAYKMLFNTRYLGTPWQVPVVHYQTPRPSKPSNSRWPFLRWRAVILFCRYLALCIYWDPNLYFRTPDGSAWTAFDYSPENQFIIIHLSKYLASRSLGRGTLTRAAALRFHMLLDDHLRDYLTLSAQHDILAIIAVAANLDTGEEWPYLFGDIRQAYTVRRYWGRFWHLLIYRPCSALAGWFCAKALKLRRGHFVARYVHNGLVFILSGIMHVLAAWALDRDSCSRCGCWDSMWKYILQIGGIVAEETVEKLVSVGLMRLVPKAMRTSHWLVTFKKFVGYVWVLCWMIWVMEVTYIPSTYCSWAPTKGST
jgi:hypothetical protein